MQSLGTYLLEEHDKDVAIAAHGEGRHTGMTGRHSMFAMGREKVAAGAAVCMVQFGGAIAIIDKNFCEGDNKEDVHSKIYRGAL